MPKHQEGGQASNAQVAATNVWDVARHAMDLLYKLLNRGRIFIVIILFLLAILGYIVFTQPEENVHIYVVMLINLVSTERVYLVPLGTALTLSIGINIWMKLHYSKEIRRLTKVRKILMHGHKEGDFVILEDDHSCHVDELDEEE